MLADRKDLIMQYAEWAGIHITKDENPKHKSSSADS